MRPLLCFVQIISGSSRHHIFLVFQIVLEHLQKIQDSGLIADQREHNDTESILELCMFQQTIQDNLRIHIFSELNDNPHSLAV